MFLKSKLKINHIDLVLLRIKVLHAYNEPWRDRDVSSDCIYKALLTTIYDMYWYYRYMFILEW